MAALNIFQNVDSEHQMLPEMNSEDICYSSSGFKMFILSLQEEEMNFIFFLNFDGKNTL